MFVLTKKLSHVILTFSLRPNAKVDNSERNIKLYYQGFDLEALYGLYIIDFTIDTTVLKGFEVPIDHSNYSKY